MLITRHLLTNAIHYIPQGEIVYINNAKVACSTIKKSIWTAWDRRVGGSSYCENPHDRITSPFCRSLEDIAREDVNTFSQASFFTVVRNPYVRILSAYLDKIAATPRDAAVWFPFARRFRLRGDARLTFIEFLRLVSSEDPSLLDQHFAPQYVNVLSDYIDYEFIGRLEEMSLVEDYLRNKDIDLRSHVPHVTRATDLLTKYYTEAEAEIVFNYFEKDFQKFGYSSSPNEILPVRACEPGPGSQAGIVSLIQPYVAPYAEGRRFHLQNLRERHPEVIADYIALEAGLLDVSAIRQLGEQAVRNKNGNWKLVSKVGQKLLDHDMIFEAASVVQRAKTLMYETGTNQ